jgi:hypothetical protein
VLNPTQKKIGTIKAIGTGKQGLIIPKVMKGPGKRVRISMFFTAQVFKVKKIIK